jgi:hypothetical protein
VTVAAQAVVVAPIIQQKKEEASLSALPLPLPPTGWKSTATDIPNYRRISTSVTVPIMFFQLGFGVGTMEGRTKAEQGTCRGLPGKAEDGQAGRGRLGLGGSILCRRSSLGPRRDWGSLRVSASRKASSAKRYPGRNSTAIRRVEPPNRSAQKNASVRATWN